MFSSCHSGSEPQSFVKNQNEACYFQGEGLSGVFSNMSVSSVTSAVRTEVVRVELLSSFPPRIGEASLDG